MRLQWWGLYHDKPKVGTFMLRIKLPSGYVTPAKLRAIGEVSNTFGRGDGELATRQNIQLHWLELARLPEVFARLDAAGITTGGGCGDTVRNITGCPVQGLDPGELFDCSGVVEEAAGFFYGNPDFSNLPRKHKYTIAACADRCNAPEINCVALVGAVHEGREGFAVRVGGGLSSVPRLSRDMGVFVPKEEAVEILERDHRRVVGRPPLPRLARQGPAQVHDRRHRRRGNARARRGRGSAAGSRTSRCPPVQVQPSDHLGIHAQKQPGLAYIGVPVHLGLISGDQMIAVADLAEAVGRRRAHHAPAELHRRERARRHASTRSWRELAAIGFPLDVNHIRGGVDRLHRRASLQLLGHGDEDAARPADRAPRGAVRHEIADLRLHLDGCPHSCAQHWVADLGFQGTTVRDERGARRQAYDIFVRGGLGPDAAIGRPLFRRVPTEELDDAVDGLVRGWLDGRLTGESFTDFSRRGWPTTSSARWPGASPQEAREREEVAA